METRKIQSVGGGTYTVSIPKEWADAQGITAGDTVELHRHLDGIFAIQAPESEQTAPTHITVHLTREETAAIERTIRAAYATGTKTVRLENAQRFTSEQKTVLDRVARNLTGVSIVEDSETTITVKTLLATSEISVTQSVRQLRFVVLSMHRDATAALAQGDAPPRAGDRDDQADRLSAMITRSFSRAIRRLDEADALGVTRAELFELWEATRELERIGDHAEAIATTGAVAGDGLDRETVTEIQGVAETTREIVSDAVSTLIDDGGVETAQQALDTRERVREEISAAEKRLGTDAGDRSGIQPVLDRLRRTAEHGGNIAEIGLKQAVRTGELTSVSGASDTL